MKKNLSQSLNKIPIIIIAIDINKQITFYNNIAKQKFLFIEEKIDINNVIRSSELNKFIEESFSNKKDSCFNAVIFYKLIWPLRSLRRSFLCNRILG